MWCALCVDNNAAIDNGEEGTQPDEGNSPHDDSSHTMGQPEEGSHFTWSYLEDEGELTYSHGFQPWN